MDLLDRLDFASAREEDLNGLAASDLIKYHQEFVALWKKYLDYEISNPRVMKIERVYRLLETL